jgi:hypothetical protein
MLIREMNEKECRGVLERASLGRLGRTPRIGTGEEALALTAF